MPLLFTKRHQAQTIVGSGRVTTHTAVRGCLALRSTGEENFVTAF